MRVESNGPADPVQWEDNGTLTIIDRVKNLVGHPSNRSGNSS